MKKLFLICACLMLVGCSNNKVETTASLDIQQNEVVKESETKAEKESKKEISLQDAIDAFQKQGYDVPKNEKPYYQMIGASDGIIFYIDDNVVKIYEYESKESLNTAKQEYSQIVSSFVEKDNLLLETHSQTALDIFNNL